MMNKHWIFTLGVFTLVGLVTFSVRTSPERTPSSNSTPSSLMNEVIGLTSPFTQTPISSSDCASRLDRVIEEVKKLDPKKFSRNDVETHAEEALRSVFLARIELHDQMKRLYNRNDLTEECARRIHRAFRHLRGVEDFVGRIGFEAEDAKNNKQPVRVMKPYDPTTLRVDNTGVRSPQYLPAIKSEFPSPSIVSPPFFMRPNMMINPHFTTPPGVKSGDILLSRGNANASALIARMGDEDTQFSHLALVYIDEKKKIAVTLEAHIEFGSIITPLKDWLSDGKARTLIFRYPDSELAHRSAKLMYDRVKGNLDRGVAIHYDFSFNMHDHGNLFCSEVAREGYEKASGGKVMIPEFPSHLSMKNRNLMDRLGIKETQSFIPADMEIDPRFTLIGEWRDFSKLPTVWKKDAILTSIYSWMERDEFKFDPSTWLNTKGGLAKVLRKLGFVEDKMPTYMTHETVVTNLMLDEVAGGLEEVLAEKEKSHRQKTGYPMSYYEYLEEFDRYQASNRNSDSGVFKFLHR